MHWLGVSGGIVIGFLVGFLYGVYHTAMVMTEDEEREP